MIEISNNSWYNLCYLGNDNDHGICDSQIANAMENWSNVIELFRRRLAKFIFVALFREFLILREIRIRAHETRRKCMHDELKKKH